MVPGRYESGRVGGVDTCPLVPFFPIYSFVVHDLCLDLCPGGSVAQGGGRSSRTGGGDVRGYVWDVIPVTRPRTPPPIGHYLSRRLVPPGPSGLNGLRTH